MAAPDGLHKVGMSTNPMRRARQLHATVMWTSVAAYSVKVAEKIEATALNLLRDYWVKWEFFDAPLSTMIMATRRRWTVTTT
jgi:hypothetical protein